MSIRIRQQVFSSLLRRFSDAAEHNREAAQRTVLRIYDISRNRSGRRNRSLPGHYTGTEEKQQQHSEGGSIDESTSMPRC
jgi:hypothetical protein